jgi:predicted lipoprotein with Yx(FWY)xxD motif
VRSSFALAAAVSTLALLAGCGSSSTTTTSVAVKSTSAASNSADGETKSTQTAASTSGSTANPTSAGVLIVSKHAGDATILAAGPKRLTVYLFEADHGSTSTCSGECAQVWPPVTTTGAPAAHGAAQAADLGTITRSDGTTQVTYKGHPLYYYVKDKDDGDTYGQGLDSFGAGWYELKPSGEKLDNS